MSKKQKIEMKKDEPEEITIDYDNIDIQDIMNQIKTKISRSPESSPDPEESSPAGIGHVSSYVLEPEYTPEPEHILQPEYTPEPENIPEPEKQGIMAKVKKFLALLMKPFAPIIKLLVYPVHKELMETIRKLDETNQRMDFLYEKHLPEIRRAIDVVGARIDNFNFNVNNRIDKAFKDMDNFNIKANERIDTTFENIQNTNERVDMAFKDIHKIKEYTKLLHALSHNMVVEMSKLKIE